MNDKITNLTVYERAKKEGKYIIDRKSTVRSASAALNVPKSTLHKDVTKVLENYHDPLYKEVRKILDKNAREKHIRGGEATKRKYLSKFTK